jgi:hypothetical protein
VAETENSLTRGQRWYREKIETDSEYVVWRRELAKLRMREYRAKMATADPNWLEEQRRRDREAKRVELLDPDQKAARNAKVRAYRQRRKQQEPGYHEGKLKAYKATYEKRKAERPDFVLGQSQLQRQRRYGLTDAEFLKMVEDQNDLCAICRQPETAMIRDTLCRLAIDHDHNPPFKVRGLLCKQCNLGLGKFGDSPARLRAAADYLETHST